MKIRNGFVSNSSSSSFIIDHFELYDYENNKEWNKETVKEEVKNIFEKWLKNRKNNVKRDSTRYVKHWHKYNVELGINEVIQQNLDYYNNLKQNMKNFDKSIYVDKVENIKSLVQKLGLTTLEYWYAGKDLEKENIVIFDPDNFLPDEVNRLVAKRFGIPNYRRNHHMG